MQLGVGYLSKCILEYHIPHSQYSEIRFSFFTNKTFLIKKVSHLNATVSLFRKEATTIV